MVAESAGNCRPMAWSEPKTDVNRVVVPEHKSMWRWRNSLVLQDHCEEQRAANTPRSEDEPIGYRTARLVDIGVVSVLLET